MSEQESVKFRFLGVTRLSDWKVEKALESFPERWVQNYLLGVMCPSVRNTEKRWIHCQRRGVEIICWALCVLPFEKRRCLVGPLFG